MSLNWNIGDCADGADVLWSDEHKAMTEALIFATMSIGIGRWTEQNIEDVYARLKLIEALYGCLVYEMRDGKREDHHLTPEDVRRYIGLRTNVAPETRASFVKRHVSDPRTGLMADWTRRYRRETAEVSAA